MSFVSISTKHVIFSPWITTVSQVNNRACLTGDATTRFRSLRSDWFHQSESTDRGDPEESVSNVGSGKDDQIHYRVQSISCQTLIFSDVELYGEPDDIYHDPPNILIELFDQDQYVRNMDRLNSSWNIS